jgi:hypothetical protein
MTSPSIALPRHLPWVRVAMFAVAALLVALIVTLTVAFTTGGSGSATRSGSGGAVDTYCLTHVGRAC